MSFLFPDVPVRFVFSSFFTHALAEPLPGGLTSLGLNFEYCREIGEEGARVLAESLPAGLTSLDLNLCNADVGDEGVRALAERLPVGLTSYRPRLQRLAISAPGARAVAYAVESLTYI